MVAAEAKRGRQLGEFIIDVNDFVTAHQSTFPELDNFLGFDDDQQLNDVEEVKREEAGDDEMAVDSGTQYQEHLDLSELLMGIKEGRFFQGRLNVSRLTIEEATVNV